MSAAGLPWIFVALWLHFALPNSGLAWGSALLMARFAAPTSAGILFNMLEAKSKSYSQILSPKLWELGADPEP